jgi:hypothetical protein
MFSDLPYRSRSPSSIRSLLRQKSLSGSTGSLGAVSVSTTSTIIHPTAVDTSDMTSQQLCQLGKSLLFSRSFIKTIFNVNMIITIVAQSILRHLEMLIIKLLGTNKSYMKIKQPFMKQTPQYSERLPCSVPDHSHHK